MTPEENLENLAQLLKGVNHQAPINSQHKYGSALSLIASCAQLPSNAVYASQISKPDNLDVRLGQSKDARNAKLAIALILDGKLNNSLIGAAHKFSQEYGRTLLLLEQKQDATGESWRPVAGFSSAGDKKALATLERLKENFGSFEIRQTQGQLFSVTGFTHDAIGHALVEGGNLRAVLSAATETDQGLDEVEAAVVQRRRQIVAQLQQLVARPGTTETDLQRALGVKHWLFGGRYVGIIPRRKFTFLDEYDIPLLCADGSLHIVEIKGPCIERLIVKHRGHLIVGKEVHEAVGQTVNYLRALDDQRTALQTELSEELGMEVDLRRVRSTVVIGHPAHVRVAGVGLPSRLQIDQTIRAYNSHLSRIEVLTYSDLLDSAEQALRFEGEKVDG
ncbi:Shedu anti-phage system protein SduA domain-containing protein [Streptomyces sp. NPDC055089]